MALPFVQSSLQYILLTFHFFTANRCKASQASAKKKHGRWFGNRGCSAANYIIITVGCISDKKFIGIDHYVLTCKIIIDIGDQISSP